MTFSMGAALEPDDTTQRTLAIEEYVASSCFRVDAVNWIADGRRLPASLSDQIYAAYIDSKEFDTVIDDALSGECSWAC